MTTAPCKPASQPDTRAKAAQVQRVMAVLERWLVGPSKTIRIVRTISTLKRKGF